MELELKNLIKIDLKQVSLQINDLKNHHSRINEKLQIINKQLREFRSSIKKYKNQLLNDLHRIFCDYVDKHENPFHTFADLARHLNNKDSVAYPDVQKIIQELKETIWILYETRCVYVSLDLKKNNQAKQIVFNYPPYFLQLRISSDSTKQYFFHDFQLHPCITSTSC